MKILRILIPTVVILSMAACQEMKNSACQPQHFYPKQFEKSEKNLIKNGAFSEGKRYWNPWQYGGIYSNLVKVVTYKGRNGKYQALRIENPHAKLTGLNQAVKVKAGKIYKLSAAARSTVTNSSAIIFGARVGIRLPHQRERKVIWMTEFNDWWKKKRIITNGFTGTAVVYIDMGYGNVISTGEFADVRLEVVSSEW